MPREIERLAAKAEVEEGSVSCSSSSPSSKKARLLVEVRRVVRQGSAIEGTEVSHGGATQKTPKTGLVDFGMVDPGTHQIRVVHKGYRYRDGNALHETFAEDIAVNEGDDSVKVIVMLEPEVSLFLDARRTGDPGQLINFDLDRWEWGVNGCGAMALCNTNDSDGKKQPDNADDKINGQADLADIAPLDVRSLLNPQEMLQCQNTQILFSFADQQEALRLRIFNGRVATSVQLLGPGMLETDLFKIWETAKSGGAAPSCLELGMEAIRYDLNRTEEPIQLRLRFIVEGVELLNTVGLVCVAPWMMHHHLVAPLALYAFQATNPKDNTAFRQELGQAATVQVIELPAVQNDLWGQDCMEFGGSALPNHAISTVIPAPRANGFAPSVEQLLSAQIGFFPPLQGAGPRQKSCDQDKLGNLEVTPPLPGYPFGRIYYGRGNSNSMDPRLIEFLHAQRVQAPFEIDISWLDVGHVDEVISFVPCQAGGAWTCVCDMPMTGALINFAATADPTGVLLRGRIWRGAEGEGGGQSVETSLGSLDSLPDEALIRKANGEAVGQMGAVRKSLLGAGVPADRFLCIPTIFAPGRTKCTGFLTANMVNMVVLQNRCIMAKPFGPEIQAVLLTPGRVTELAQILRKTHAANPDFPAEQALVGALNHCTAGLVHNNFIDIFELATAGMFRALGLEARFIDDWQHYHSGGGEVHCGTNVRRQPQAWHWWEVGSQMISAAAKAPLTTAPKSSQPSSSTQAMHASTSSRNMSMEPSRMLQSSGSSRPISSATPSMSQSRLLPRQGGLTPRPGPTLSKPPSRPVQQSSPSATSPTKPQSEEKPRKPPQEDD
jgi:hypothetical protein